MGTNENHTGVSRRDLLKKGAVAGGIVWTAPIVLSARDIAGAQATSAPVCDHYYIFKLNVQSGQLGTCDGGAGNSCVNRDDPTNTYDSGCDFVSITQKDKVGDKYVVTFTYIGEGVVDSVVGFAKIANTDCPEFAPTSGSGDGPYTFEFPVQYDTDPTEKVKLQDTSHVEIALCVLDAPA